MNVLLLAGKAYFCPAIRVELLVDINIRLPVQILIHEGGEGFTKSSPLPWDSKTRLLATELRGRPLSLPEAHLGGCASGAVDRTVAILMQSTRSGTRRFRSIL
jgi:hypothetical protein